LHLLARIPLATVELRWLEPVAGPPPMRARQLRGAVAAAFADDPLFHQHGPDGRPLYRYPRVQYRWQRGAGLVVGWHDAAQKLLNLPWLDLELRLGAEVVRVAEALMRTGGGTFGANDRLRHYRLASPVLILNQKNYGNYQNLDRAGQRRERDRLLVAQLLVALRELGVEFTGRLFAAFTRARPEACRLKDQELLGFGGEFVTNAVLPAGFAVGHAVSHGYGWIEPAQGEGGES